MAGKRSNTVLTSCNNRFLETERSQIIQDILILRLRGSLSFTNSQAIEKGHHFLIVQLGEKEPACLEKYRPTSTHSNNSNFLLQPLNEWMSTPNCKTTHTQDCDHH